MPVLGVVREQQYATPNHKTVDKRRLHSLSIPLVIRK